MGTELRFWKMSGAGNDFIVLPRAPGSLGEDPAVFVRRLCRRGVSVGADGVLFVTSAAPSAGQRAGTIEPPSMSAAPALLSETRSPGTAYTSTADGTGAAHDAVLVHYNADGGRSDFCGNGSRCAARFAVLMGFASWPVALRTDCGILRAERTSLGVRIEVPAPSPPVPRTLVVDGTPYAGAHLLAGVPHFVLRVADPSAIDVARLGAALRAHPDLGPAGANVDFVGGEGGEAGRAARTGDTSPATVSAAAASRPDLTAENAARWRVRTFERGVEAETLACGSGAIAVAAVLAREGARSPIVVRPTSGIDLTVDFEDGPGGPRGFHLAGEARVVYEGSLASEVAGT